MKKMELLSVVLCCLIGSNLSAGITCGSQNSGIKVTGSASLVVSGGGLTLTNGMIRTTSTNTISGTVTCSNSRIEYDRPASDDMAVYSLDGSYNLSTDAMTIGPNQTVHLRSGKTVGAITITGTSGQPSILEGAGDFASSSLVINSGKQLNIDLQSTLNCNITNYGTLKLLDDLKFGDGCKIQSGTVNCNDKKLVFGQSDFSMSSLTIEDPSIIFNSKVTLAGNWTLAGGSPGYINANGNVLDFNGSFINLNNQDLTIVDATLAQIQSGSFLSTSCDLYFSNVILAHSTSGIGAICIKGIGAPGAGVNALAKVTLANNSSFFDSGKVTFDNEVTIELIKPVDLRTIWDFDSTAYINGNGQTLILGDNDPGTGDDGVLDLGGTSNAVYLSNIKLVGVVATSMVNFGDLYTNNVTIQSGADAPTAGELTISGNSDSNNGYAQISPSGGNWFKSDVTFDNGANIELQNNVTLTDSAVWTFAGDTVINGNGNVLDISTGSFVINAGCALCLRNMILKGWTGSTASSGDGQIQFVNASSSALHLSDMAIMLGGDVTFSQGEIHVSGPTNMITGGYKFTTSSNGDLYINGVTLWYDTLNRTPDNNVSPENHDGTLVHYSNGGSIKAYRAATNSMRFPNELRPFLGSSVELYQSSGYTGVGDESDATNTGSVTMTFSVGNGNHPPYDDGYYGFDGNGRTVTLCNAESTAALISLDANVDLTTKNILFNGLKSGNISLGGSGGTLANITFGAGTTIRLQENDTLDKDWVFGVAPSSTFVDQATAQAAIDAETSAQMVLDLNGHTLDMGSNKIVLNIGTLTIKNGRITGLNSSSNTMFVGGNGQTPATTGHEAATFKFENVELVLEGDCNFVATGGGLEFSGHCSVSGADGKKFHFDATGSSTTKGSEQALTINSNSMLTIETGLGLKITTLQNSSGTTDRMLDHLKLINGGSSNGHGTLNLHGGLLESAGSGELLINKGRLIADHRARLDATNNTIRIGSSSATEAAGYNDPGDNTNDLTIELEPATVLNIIGGIVKYDNFAG